LTGFFVRAGWVREDDNPTTSQTYVATSGYTIDSAQVRIFETNDDQAGAGAGCTVWDYFGCRFDWSFVWNAGERWMWTFDGAAKNCDMQASTDPWFTTLAGLNYGDDEPLTAKGLTGNGLAETEGDTSTPNTASTRVIFGGGVTEGTAARACRPEPERQWQYGNVRAGVCDIVWRHRPGESGAARPADN
jgi:hypothetical protein